jgi:malate dehydrogenase
VRGWVSGTPGDDWTSDALPTDGWHDVPGRLVSSFPVRSVAGERQIVQGLELGLLLT